MMLCCLSWHHASRASRNTNKTSCCGANEGAKQLTFFGPLSAKSWPPLFSCVFVAFVLIVNNLLIN